MIPKQEDIEVPLLRTLLDLGGKAKPREVLKSILKYFPTLTDSDREETLAGGGNRWENRVHWARQALVWKGEVGSPSHGVWDITEKGKARLAGETNAPLAAPPGSQTVEVISIAQARDAVEPPMAKLEEMADAYREAFRDRVIQTLIDLDPSGFEQLAAKLLTAFGFQNMKVTNEHTAPDGGIDGNGELKMGVVTVRAAFQCKRWRGTVVGRPEVDKFRGAIQGKFEHGYFFTTSTFSKDAREASLEDGAVPIFLFDGQELAKTMIDKGLGIKRTPVEVYEDHIKSLFEKG